MRYSKYDEMERVKQRFYAKTKLVGDCLEWQGPLRKGYGRFSLNHYKSVPAHVMHWYIIFCEWPSQQLNHLCENKICVKVSHLDDVSGHDNRQYGYDHLSPRKCKWGHDKVFFPNQKGVNSPNQGLWVCVVCRNKNKRRFQ